MVSTRDASSQELTVEGRSCSLCLSQTRAPCNTTDNTTAISTSKHSLTPIKHLLKGGKSHSRNRINSFPCYIYVYYEDTKWLIAAELVERAEIILEKQGLRPLVFSSHCISFIFVPFSIAHRSVPHSYSLTTSTWHCCPLLKLPFK